MRPTDVGVCPISAVVMVMLTVPLTDQPSSVSQVSWSSTPVTEISTPSVPPPTRSAR
ncbi:hypothetical protein ACIBSS_19790 [Micromonospora aurantiaca]|uniref:hypothetical protein n=1 Tax=Micromonospora aurantiaca (nom. illeg.) TaxID=47850 RepID=UPI0037BC2130